MNVPNVPTHVSFNFWLILGHNDSEQLRPGGAPAAWAWAFHCPIAGCGPTPAHSSERSTWGQ